jgi:hypothetical protein
LIKEAINNLVAYHDHDKPPEIIQPNAIAVLFNASG